MSCPYRDILGIPGHGVHAQRIFGYALADIIMTIIGAGLYSVITGTPLYISLLVLFLLGELLHYMFGVQTAVLTTLGITACPAEKNEIIEPI